MPVTSTWIAPNPNLDITSGQTVSHSWFQNAAGDLLYLYDSLFTGASRTFYLGGNVGVGTSTPVDNVNQRSVTIDAAAFPRVDFRVGGVATGVVLGATNLMTFESIGASGAVAVVTNSLEQVRVTGQGNLGLGTATPVNNANQRSLTVNGTTASRVDFQVGGTTEAAAYAVADQLVLEAIGAGSIALATNSTTRLTLSSTGLATFTGGIAASPSAAGNTVPVLIERRTPSGVTSTTFSSIPATFRHLELRIVARSSAAGNHDEMRLQVNGLTTAIYDWQHAYQTGASAATPTSANGATSLLLWNGVPANNQTSSLWGSGVARLHEYTFGGWKSVISDAQGADPAGVINKTRNYSAGTAGTTAAITSVTVLLASGNFSAGSVVDLWGFP